ncbi:MAG: Gfo/Idh/MocA family oxidoreductase [Thermoguttaceae bacterium]|nr:Gfo/Idh/MocA family oxidoreductase [Thermoguttaceae bacterium]MDW8079132.1 Gfo/Idh/MocA family oxidoreductase [Thermoguttaceae bacterium]
MTRMYSRRQTLKAAIGGSLISSVAFASQCLCQDKESQQPGEPVRLGIIGVGSRGTYLLRILLTLNTEIPAICDIRPDRLARAVKLIQESRDGKAPATYGNDPFDYRRLLARDDVEAVLVATPMQWHAVMSVDALRAGKHVLSEVSAAITLQECWDLVNAVEETGKIYMLAENCCYWDFVMAIHNMVRQGVFGELTFAECGYVHDCRGLVFQPDGTLTWRGELARDHRGNLYPTHSLGPVAQWLSINRGDRLLTLVAAETKQAAMKHFINKNFPTDHPSRNVTFKSADSTTVLIRTARGALIDLRYDVKSARPHPTTVYYALQGTTASYDSRINSIWIEGRSQGYQWEPIDRYLREFEDPLWTTYRAQVEKLGYAGGDYFELQQFLECVRRGKPSPIDVYDAASWSAITSLSELSLNEGGRVVEIPDFTRGKWESRS